MKRETLIRVLRVRNYRLYSLAFFVALVFSGCTAEQPTAQRPTSLGDLLSGVAHSRQVAQAYDRATRAADAGDADTFLATWNKLGDLNATAQLRVLSDSLTRNANSLNDANLLNALGYPLAEKGREYEQFLLAEKLTRRSLELWDAAIASQRVQGSPVVLEELRLIRASVRDSVAWALFRQKRFDAALKEQQSAVNEAISASRPLKRTVPGELYYHLGEIYRALGNQDAAREQYRLALQADAKHAASQAALRSLEATNRDATMP